MAFQYNSDVGDDSIQGIIAAMKSSSIPFTVSSTYRPGSITVSGKLSYHARKNAVDSYSSKVNMQNLAGWIRQHFAPYTLELIHSGGNGFFVHNGKVVSASTYGAAVVNDHYDHVHWAITNSGLKAGGASVAGASVIPASYTPSLPNSGCALPVVMVGGVLVTLGGLAAQLLG